MKIDKTDELTAQEKMTQIFAIILSFITIAAFFSKVIFF